MKKVAIFIGEPGVGKSHVINRITGRTLAAVSPPNGLDEVTEIVTTYEDKYIDTPGINGTRFSTYISDIKSESVGNNVMIVLVLPHHLTRINSWIKCVKSIIDHFNEKKLVVVWNSKLGTGMEMSTSLNEKFLYPIDHLDASAENFPSMFNLMFSNDSKFMQWTEDVTAQTNSSLQRVEKKYLAPRIRLTNFQSHLNATKAPRDLVDAIKKLCNLHGNKTMYNDLKVMGDADLRQAAARYLNISGISPIDKNLIPMISNEGHMKDMYDSYIKPHMTDDFWKNWESHAKCDFVEALIALNYGQPPATFILAKIGIKGIKES